MKYTITCNITIPFEFEICANSLETAVAKAHPDYFTDKEIISEFAEQISTMDLSNAKVHRYSVENETNIHYL